VNPAHLEAVTHRENVLRGASPVALLAARTHCLHGHEYTVENTYVSAKGSRVCRSCTRLREPAKTAARRISRFKARAA
jgi:hypothetical protein